MSRIVMFVLNDVRRDARVLREAGALVAAGHAVTIVGRPSAGDRPTAPQREQRGGFEILRVPVPGRIRGLLVAVGGGRSRTATSGPAPGAGEPATSAAAAAVRTWRAMTRVPVLGSLASGLDWLARWQLGTRAWARAAAAAAPEAAIWLGHDLTGLAAALEARAARAGRVIFDMHELYLDAGDTARRPAWARAIVGRWQRRALREVDGVVTVNDALAAVLQELAPSCRPVVVHNAPPRRPSSDVATSPLRSAAALGPGDQIALYHGALAADRGLDVILAAVRERGLERVHAVFLGDGPEGARLEALARDPRASGRIHVLPPVDPLDVVEWVAGADVAVMPIAGSTRNHRLSTPNKLFEALAAGVPVVASEFPAIGEIVLGDPEGPLGMLCDPASPAAVAAAIRSILERSPSERAELRRRCLAAAHARWNWETEAAKLVDLVAQLEPRAPTERAPVTPAAEPVPQRLIVVVPSTGEFDSRTRRIATDVATRGHEVLVIARDGDGLPLEEQLAPTGLLVRVAAGDPPRRADPADSWPLRVAGEARRILATALRTRTQAAAAEAAVRATGRAGDLVHAMGFLALPVARRLAGSGIPLVYDARDIYARSTNVSRLPGLLRRLFELRERTWARAAARVVTVNRACADYLARSLGVPEPTVVMNGQPDWSPPRHRPNRLRAALRLPARAPIVLYHGGFMPDRGLPELVRAMATPGLEAAHLVLLGSGALEAELRRLAAEPGAGGRVHILPPVPPSELLEWVASADVGAMPNQPRTLNERLSTPNKLFECLAAGTPVVSSDFPERRRIVVDDPDGPLGAVCEPRDPASIGAAIRSILELDRSARADLRARCARAARARYAWAPQLEVLLAEYGRLTGRPW